MAGAIVDLAMASLIVGGQVAVVEDANAEIFWSSCQSMSPT